MDALATVGRQVQLLVHCLKRILPAAEARLRSWEDRARSIPDPALRRLALASLDAKRFHCHGGSLYASAALPAQVPGVVAFIVALQTISDYLDNLCDRTDSLNEEDFRTLHEAMLDAVTPGAHCGGYYRHHPHREDGGYLAALVVAAQRELAALAGYRSVVPYLRTSVSLYNDLQVYKHLPWTERETKLQQWARQHGAPDYGLYWWEFGAAAGSTLTTFALTARASHGSLSPADADALTGGYFPAITALHILLDYLIDQAEDRRAGDLNFVSYYPNQELLAARLEGMLHRALEQAGALEDAPFHDLMVRGLPAIYLSDAKVEAQGLEGLRARLLAAGGPPSRILYGICRLQRARYAGSQANGKA